MHSITLNNTAENFELPIVETEEIQLITELDVHGNGEDNYYHITYRLYTDSGVALLSSSNFNKQLNLKEGKNRIICYFPKNLFKPGQYFLTFNFDNNHKVVFGEKNIISFLVQNGSKEIGTYMGAIYTYLKPDLKWEVC